MDSIFEKSVSLVAKPAAELFGDEQIVESIAAPAKKKKDLWKQTLKSVVPLENPFFEPHEEIPVKIDAFDDIEYVPPISVKYGEISKTEKSDEIFNDKLVVAGCRHEFIPAHKRQIPPPATTKESVVVEQGIRNIILIVHGVVSTDAGLETNLEKTRQAFEQVRQQGNPPCHVELINWKAGVIGLQSSLFDRIIPRGSLPVESRVFVAYSISDVAFYLTPSHCELIKSLVVSLLNKRITELKNDTKFANAKITLVGYSLGSVIVHDILTELPSRLDFEVSHVFFWGSPLAAYLSVKDSQFQRGRFDIPKKFNVFNIYHPHDPVAFRIEPLFYHMESDIADAEPVPVWDASNSSSSTKNGWNSLFGFGANSDRNTSAPLAPKRRLDYVLQESVTESFSHQFSMLTAHHSYWSSRDVALFMLKKINED